jgi:hypothetical protein
MMVGKAVRQVAALAAITVEWIIGYMRVIKNIISSQLTFAYKG